jgi:hypothetical protein
MVAYGVGGVLSSQQVPLGWGCRRTSGKVGIRSLVSLDSSWGMAPRLAFGMICSVETGLSK